MTDNRYIKIIVSGETKVSFSDFVEQAKWILSEEELEGKSDEDIWDMRADILQDCLDGFAYDTGDVYIDLGE